ncbi:MAG: M56 family metallopeptidase, partial [Phycisphaerales bacterium]
QWAMLWQTAVLIGVVAVIDRLIRKRAWPQLRYMLWLLVFVKLILPPTLASPLSLTSHVPALAQKAMEAGIQTQVPPADNRVMGPQSAEPTALSTAQTPFGTEPLAADPPQIPPLQGQPVRTSVEPLSWTVYAMGIWLAGVVVLATGLHVRLRRLSKEHTVSQPRDVPNWFDGLVAQTAAELGLRRVPRVVFSERVCCPAVFGVLRPVLLFPADRLPITRQETRHILLHELAHIKRGDLLVHAGYMILATVYWFNPLLWLIRKHVQNLRELCCDATVARHLREETAAYRETLLATGRALLARPVDPGLGLLGLFENSGWLPTRLQWLQKKTWRHPWLRRTSVVAVAILMLCCILPMASIDAASEIASDQEFQVTLPNGITIELVGIRKPETDQWWRPDGTPLTEAPYDSSKGDPQHKNPYEFAVRYENLPEGVTGGIRVDSHGGGCGGAIPETMDKLMPHQAGKPVENMAYLITDQDPATQAVTVRVDLATGEWATEETEILCQGSSGGWSSHKCFSPTLDAVVGPAMPYEQNGRVYTALFCASSDPTKQKYDARLTAVDFNGEEHSPVDGGNGGSFFNRVRDKALANCAWEFDLPLKDIHCFNLQTRPHTWIEFKNVSLRPGERQKVEVVTTEPSQAAVVDKQRELPMASSAVVSENQSFKVALPSGGTIELIGARRTGTDRWWRPDGTPLAEAPYDSSEGTDRSDGYEVALRYENLPKGSSGGIDIEGSVWGGSIPMWYAELQKAGKPIEGVTYVIVSAQELETTTVRVYLAAGDWKTDSTHPRSSNGWNACAHGGPVIGSIICSMPYEREGRTYATVTYSALEKDKCDVRLTALDISNVEHLSDDRGGLWTSPGFAQITPDFNLPLEDVAAFNLQTRPYTWIEFKNVSLRPGRLQKVEIVTTEPPGSAPARKRDWIPEGFSSLRDYSSQILQAFHIACTRYMDEHPASELPDRPWGLKFRFAKPVLVNGRHEDMGISPLQYLAHAGYFRSGGFPSLKREDFESSEASRTPILYCKSLLDAEDGKGTNVLFGDGHVEYVTAEELGRLKAATAASTDKTR